MRRYRDLLHRTDGPPGSAWGEFGPDDELGTIGRLTPDRARAGAACVRTGEVFNLDLPMDAMDPPLAAARRTARHTIFGRNAFHRDEHLDDVFPQASSQIDGLRHFGHPDHGFYNGASGERLVPGDPLLGMQHWAEHGIVGRAVLVDVGLVVPSSLRIACQNSDHVRADLVRHVAIRRNSIRTDHDGLHASFLHHVTAHIVRDKCYRDIVLH